MIIRSYLAREIYLTTLVVTVVLLAISLGGRVIAYLQDAASGLFTTDVLFALILYRIPGLLEIIVPIAFFLGIVLGYGRLHMDSEMIVLRACGMRPRRLVGETLLFSLLIAAIVGSMSLAVRPWSQSRIEQIREQQESLTEFDLLIPGRFQSMSDGQRVTYTQEIDSEKETMKNLFVVEHLVDEEGEGERVDMVLASEGAQQVNPDSGSRFLVLRNGSRAIGAPGEPRYRRIEYEELGRLIKSTARKRRTKIDALPTPELRQRQDVRAQSELQWRVSIILLVPIAALMAIPLSQVNPRQGRFARLIPGLILIFLYLVLLSISRNAVVKEQISPLIGLWWVHALFLAIALTLYRALALLERLPLPAPGKSIDALDAGEPST